MSDPELKAGLDMLQKGQAELLGRVVSIDKTLRGDNGNDGLITRIAVLENKVAAQRLQARFIWGALVTLGAPVVQMVFQALSK